MEHVIHLLSQYKYVVLFPLAIVEGPIIAVIAGFLCTTKFLNPFIVFPIIVAGDMIGDSLVYMLGRFGVPPFLRSIVKKFGLKPENMQAIRSYFDANPAKTISFSKITLGIGFAGIYLAGNTRIPYGKFIQVCLLTSALQYIVYLTIGLLFGSAYKQISHYMDIFTALTIVIVLAILLFIFIRSKRKKP